MDTPKGLPIGMVAQTSKVMPGVFNIAERKMGSLDKEQLVGCNLIDLQKRHLTNIECIYALPRCTWLQRHFPR